MSYNNKIQIIIDKMGLSQKDFANKLGVSQNAISHYLLGKRNPDINTIQKLIDLGVPFEYIKEYVDGIITVSDYELMDAFLVLVEKHKLVAENSGILSLAALKKLNEKNKKVVSLISGGNIDVLSISSMINKGLIERGRIFSFSVQLPDIPGQLEKVAHLLNECNANVVAVDHNQFKNFARFSEVELRVTCETNGEAHIDTIIETFKQNGLEIHRVN